MNIAKYEPNEIIRQIDIKIIIHMTNYQKKTPIRQ